MKENTFIGIIPARYASSRFPGKPLAKIDGVMMIERVWRRVSSVLDKVYVATDDERIREAVLSFGGNVVMTSTSHRSGTDRCKEAYDKIGDGRKVIINIQGDEPFIEPEQLRAIMRCFDSPETQIATLVRPFDAADGFDSLVDNNTPKVTFDKNMNALYFSRSVIPYIRNVHNSEWAEKHQFYTHVGMYAYTAPILAELTRLPQSSLELAESLEQLRWIENGYKIKVGVTNAKSIGIDTPGDLQRAEEMLKRNEL